ncbi:MAG: type II toxin-antitoxin system VapC family toxin [Candidatus Njordarchaeia archaeon]
MEKDSFVVDTSVLIEYISVDTPYRKILDKLLRSPEKFGISLFVSPVTLSEVLYVADRVYRAAGVKTSNQEAKRFLQWLKNRVKTVSINDNIVELAGEIKKYFHLALSDCYAIATGKHLGYPILFKKIERKMERHIKELRKMGVRFLDEIE